MCKYINDTEVECKMTFEGISSFRKLYTNNNIVDVALLHCLIGPESK